MSQSDAYFQFPISHLRPPPHVSRQMMKTPALIQRLLNYSAWHYGVSLYQQQPEIIADLAAEYLEQYPNTKCDRRSNHHKILMAAAQRLNYKIGDIAHSLSVANEAINRYGEGGTQCRIRSDIFWSAHNGDWPLMKWLVLCGVFAGIGANPYARLTHTLIQALGAGYKSPRECHKSDLLPKSSVRYWLDQLWYQNLFQHCTRGSERWYSIRHADDTALALDIKNRTVRKPVKKRVDANRV